jgi:alpha-L-arabinofuranosidase
MTKAKVVLARELAIGEIDARLYGSFIEHLAERSMEAFTSRAMQRLTIWDFAAMCRNGCAN